MDIKNIVRIFKYKKKDKIVGRWFDSNNRNPGDQGLAAVVELTQHIIFNSGVADTT